jgi:hypothetical protein
MYTDRIGTALDIVSKHITEKTLGGGILERFELRQMLFVGLFERQFERQRLR